MTQEYDNIHCGQRCQVGFWIWPPAYFQSDRSGLVTMLTEQLQLKVIPCSFRKLKQTNSVKERKKGSNKYKNMQRQNSTRFPVLSRSQYLGKFMFTLKAHVQ